MARFSAVCCLLLLSSWYQACTGNPFLVGIALYEKAMLVYDSVEKYQQAQKPEEPSNAAIYNKLNELSDDYQSLRYEVLEKISSNMITKLTLAAKTFFDNVKHIDSKYNEFLRYLNNPGEDIGEFAKSSTSKDLGQLPRVLGVLYESFSGHDYEENSLLSIVAKNSSAQDMICLKQQSKQQLINDLYKAYVDSSIKGLIVILFSYEARAKLENKPFADDRKHAKEDFQTRLTKSFEYYKNALKIASREIYRCDPGQHEQYVTYGKLQEVFQAFVINEMDTASADKGRMVLATAWATQCSDMKDVRLRCGSAECKAQPSDRQCTGHLRDCQKLPKGFEICHSPEESDRRYDWLRVNQEEDVALYGRFKPNCPRTQTVELDVFEKIIEKFVEDRCVCNCESEHMAVTRYFSLRDVLSDVDDNKVVTGVQLVKDFYVFQIKIKQGTLGPSGNVTDEPHWKDIISIEAPELTSNKVSKYHYDGKGLPREDLAYQEWVEFFKNDLVYAVTYKQNRVYLDTVEAGPNRVVTGLRFKQAGDDLKLEIQTTPFDYDTGVLNKAASTWKSNENGRQDREELILSHPDDPTRFHRSSVDSTDNQFIQFRMSDLERDFGQVTVPFIDLQEVSINPPLPLSGVGMIHRGEKYSGGFLGLKVIHYDYTDHL